jgi:hypothetical protein
MVVETADLMVDLKDVQMVVLMAVKKVLNLVDHLVGIMVVLLVN